MVPTNVKCRVSAIGLLNSPPCVVFVCPSVEEQLFRSVEGQAASDEEEEKWTGKQQSQVDEVKRILTRLSCCGERYSLLTMLHGHATVSTNIVCPPDNITLRPSPSDNSWLVL